MKKRQTNVMENEMRIAWNGTKQVRDNVQSKTPDGIWGKNEEAMGFARLVAQTWSVDDKEKQYEKV